MRVVSLSSIRGSINCAIYYYVEVDLKAELTFSINQHIRSTTVTAGQPGSGITKKTRNLVLKDIRSTVHTSCCICGVKSTTSVLPQLDGVGEIKGYTYSVQGKQGGLTWDILAV